MRVSEALERVSAFYVPGVVKYYSRFNPDPWQAAHEELEKVAGIFDEELVTAATTRFVSRCEELVKRFNQDNMRPLSPDASDWFHGGDTRIQAHLSRRHKKCAKCASKEGLKIVPVAPDSTDVHLLCARCMP